MFVLQEKQKEPSPHIQDIVLVDSSHRERLVGLSNRHTDIKLNRLDSNSGAAIIRQGESYFASLFQFFLSFFLSRI